MDLVQSVWGSLGGASPSLPAFAPCDSAASEGGEAGLLGLPRDVRLLVWMQLPLASPATFSCERQCVKGFRRAAKRARPGCASA